MATFNGSSLMKTKPILRLALSAVLLSTLHLQLSTALAQDTAFTYQGRLNVNGVPANGSYEFSYWLFAVRSGGSAIAGPLANAPIGVTNGLFTVTLDFGNVFPGADRWLQIAVRTNGGGPFSILSPRQRLTSAPYAIQAANATSAASANSVAAANITGTLTTSQLPSSVVTNGQTGVNLIGTFSGNGMGVSNLNLSLNSGGAILFAGRFVLSSSPGVGNSPRSVTAADVNGDGKVDLITANNFASTLTVLTNNGSGGFGLSSSPAAGFNPYSVAAADVNGDGKVDLICANLLSPGTLRVLTNNGSGGFGLSSSLPLLGDDPYSVVAADVNGDGKVDLISPTTLGGPLDGRLTVLTNNGSGGFGVASLPLVGSDPRSVTAADVNGDGKVDLICANYGSGSLTVLTNNGSGNFVPRPQLFLGSGPRTVAAADVNGDGKVDLITANPSNNSLTVLTNNGSGGFAIASMPGAGSNPFSVTAADINGDGKVDLICANLADDNTLTVLTNNGTGGFVLSSSPGVGSAPFWVTAADVNGDGNVDLISANEVANTLSVLFNALTFRGSFVGDGAGLTGLTASQIPELDASKITSGTLADGLLSSNVALRFGGNTFSGDQFFTNGALYLTGRARVRAADPGSASFAEFVDFTSTFRGFAGMDGTGLTGTSNQLSVGTTTAHPVKFFTGNAERMVIGTTGNVGIGVAIPGNRLHVGGGVTATAFVPTSDRNAKENFAPVSPQEVLNKVAALPISTWNFKELKDGRHIGPTAQDFKAAFDLGNTETGIATVDADGVALAAIQGLNHKLTQELKQKQTEITELKQELAKLKTLVQSLARKQQQRR